MINTSPDAIKMLALDDDCIKRISERGEMKEYSKGEMRLVIHLMSFYKVKIDKVFSIDKSSCFRGSQLLFTI